MRIFVKPKPGILVRDPRTRQIIPPEGKAVSKSTYWLRRVRSGDVVLTTKGGIGKTEPKPLVSKKEGVKNG